LAFSPLPQRATKKVLNDIEDKPLSGDGEIPVQQIALALLTFLDALSQRSSVRIKSKSTSPRFGTLG
ncbi:hypothetical protein, partial [Paraburkholderia sp. DHOC27]|uniref:hypothetical protein n=1 Tax=Paraburkholderia sp. DHOC27 TaxID=2303330 RepID=UPI001C704F05